MKKIKASKIIFKIAILFFICENIYFGGLNWHKIAKTPEEHICDLIVTSAIYVALYLYVSPVLKYIENEIKNGIHQNKLTIFTDNSEQAKILHTSVKKLFDELKKEQQVKNN